MFAAAQTHTQTAVYTKPACMVQVPARGTCQSKLCEWQTPPDRDQTSKQAVMHKVPGVWAQNNTQQWGSQQRGVPCTWVPCRLRGAGRC